MGFTLEDGHPNVIEGGKRPLHTIIPGMATKDGKAVLSFGVMGGHYQAMGQAQFMSRHFDYGLDIQEAMDAPRFMPDPFNGEVEMEATVPDAIQQDLRARGHRLVKPRAPVGGSQAIEIDWQRNLLTAGSDPRKDGCAIGY
ncbi:gamma-glutamyltransferase [Pacificispira sp.]|uniref:gamma-glutamyltransferase n=1 Tax=Pacificispira sp. TaxID=2888761 RepID=UPI003B52CB6D